MSLTWEEMHGCYHWTPEEVAEVNQLIREGVRYDTAIRVVAMGNREEADRAFRRVDSCVRDLHLGELPFISQSDTSSVLLCPRL